MPTFIGEGVLLFDDKSFPGLLALNLLGILFFCLNGQ